MSRYYARWRPSPKQQHYNMHGKPKRPYATAADAEEARIAMTYKTGYAFHVYRCKACHKLHIGKELLGE